MTRRRIPAPGNPTAAELAAADQKHALARAAVSKLVDDTRRGVIAADYDPDDFGVWVDVAMHDCIDAAVAMSDDDQTLIAALAGMLSEAVLRLARTEVPA